MLPGPSVARPPEATALLCFFSFFPFSSINQFGVTCLELYNEIKQYVLL